MVAGASLGSLSQCVLLISLDLPDMQEEPESHASRQLRSCSLLVHGDTPTCFLLFVAVSTWGEQATICNDMLFL